MLRLATASPTRNSMNPPSSFDAIVLRTPGDQRIDVQLPLVAGHGRELVVELRGRQRAVLDHHLIDGARLLRVVVLVAKHRQQPVAVALHAAQAVVRGHPDPLRVETVEVDRVVRRTDLVSRHPVRGHELDLRPARGGESPPRSDPGGPRGRRRPGLRPRARPDRQARPMRSPRAPRRRSTRCSALRRWRRPRCPAARRARPRPRHSG